jgi:hypothetical protein
MQTLLRELTCSMCGRPWSGTDGKWPIRVTSTDPPRAAAHCLTCADMGAGYDARWCPAEMRAESRFIFHRNGNGADPVTTAIPVRARLKASRQRYRLRSSQRSAKKPHTGGR